MPEPEHVHEWRPAGEWSAAGSRLLACDCGEVAYEIREGAA